MEALHLHQHPEEAGVGGVGRLGEDPAEALGARVLEPAAVAAHRHAHVGGLGLHPELAEEAQQRGVRAQVVHDEAAVDGHDAPVGGHDIVGVRVATETRLGLVERHVALALQHVRGGESGDAGTDDRDATAIAVGAHDATSPVTSRQPATRASSSGTIERRVVGDGGGERGGEPVPGGRARQHAVTAPRHVQAHGAPGDRHGPGHEPRRRTRDWSCGRGCRAAPRGRDPASCSTGSVPGNHGAKATTPRTVG